MSETRFTPGPWEVVSFVLGRPEVPIAAGGVLIAQAQATKDKDANGALIAAAPDLYAALKDTLRETEEHYCDIIGARDAMFQDNVPPKVAAAYREELARMDGVISRARAALSKATVKPGGAPQADASVPPQTGRVEAE